MPPGPCERQQVTAARSPGHESFSCSAPWNSRQLTPGVAGETGADFAPLGLQRDVSAEPSFPPKSPHPHRRHLCPSPCSHLSLLLSKCSTGSKLKRTNQEKKVNLLILLLVGIKPVQLGWQDQQHSPEPRTSKTSLLLLPSTGDKPFASPGLALALGNAFPTFSMLEKPRLMHVFNPEPSSHCPFRFAGLFPV